jgi:hypothetical protein
MFDSPIEWCSRYKVWVAIDQTFAECARERNCTLEQCPLVKFLKREQEQAVLPARPEAAVQHLAER